MEADLWAFEKPLADKGHTRIAGVDEAGRGPLAGPVVAAAVVLPTGFRVGRVRDSKQLSRPRREALFTRIYAEAAAVGIGIVDALEIDRINILQAARLAMAMAVANLQPAPDCLLIDGNCAISGCVPQQTLVGGDRLSVSVAAASIVAKVTRDRIMIRYHADFPQFGFDQHKGYPTLDHKAAIVAHGPSPIHRRTFRGVREHLPAGVAPPFLHRSAPHAPL
jgi:ribonuclease HII